MYRALLLGIWLIAANLCSLGFHACAISENISANSAASNNSYAQTTSVPSGECHHHSDGAHKNLPTQKPFQKFPSSCEQCNASASSLKSDELRKLITDVEATSALSVTDNRSSYSVFLMPVALNYDVLAIDTEKIDTLTGNRHPTDILLTSRPANAPPILA